MNFLLFFISYAPAFKDSPIISTSSFLPGSSSFFLLLSISLILSYLLLTAILLDTLAFLFPFFQVFLYITLPSILVIQSFIILFPLP
jgi:hypothetical protein